MKIVKWFSIPALVLGSSAAYAGLFSPVPVSVDVESGLALGDMTTARFSDNDVEIIGCGVRFSDDGKGGAATFGFCQAADAAGTVLFCSTVNTGLIEAIQNISAFSFITFTVDSETGQCLNIGNSSQSFYISGALAPPDEDDD